MGRRMELSGRGSLLPRLPRITARGFCLLLLLSWTLLVTACVEPSYDSGYNSGAGWGEEDESDEAGYNTSADYRLSGVLEPGDRQLASGEWEDSYRISVESWDTVELWVEADFDSYLIIKLPWQESQLDDDDSGGGLTARVSFVAEGTGYVEVLVTTAGVGEQGSYTLCVRGATRPGVLARLDTTMTGELAAGDRSYGTGEWVDDYSLEIPANTDVRVTMRSSDIDAFLSVSGPDGTSFGDDDGGGGSDAQAILSADEAGVWRIGATSYGAEDGGSYSISFMGPDGEEPGTGEPETPPEPDPLSVDELEAESIAGSLSDLDEQRENGAWSDTYRFVVRDGQPVVLWIESGFDSYLIASGPIPELVKLDDDGGDGNNARLELLPSADGRLEVQVSAYEAGVTGDYRLFFRDAVLLAEAPPATVVTVGTELTGALDGADGQDPEGKWVDVFALELGSVAKVRVTLRSSAFDAYLVATTPDGLRLSDDDDGGGHDAELILDAELGNAWHIQATSFSTPAMGAYSIAFMPVVEKLADSAETVEEGTEAKVEGDSAPLEPLVIAGELNAADDLPGSARRSDTHSFSVRAGAPVSVRVEADFDATLMVRGPAWETREDDDDGSGKGRVTRMELLPADDGTLIIEVRATPGTWDEGSYVLHVGNAALVTPER